MQISSKILPRIPNFVSSV